jgi:hypothetical protein
MKEPMGTRQHLLVYMMRPASSLVHSHVNKVVSRLPQVLHIALISTQLRHTLAIMDTSATVVNNNHCFPLRVTFAGLQIEPSSNPTFSNPKFTKCTLHGCR